MAYYVGNQQFPSVYAAARFLAQNPQPGMTITSTPVAPAGMLTKPAPTTKQTGPIGTPSTPPKQMPGESGPFDPNAPVPTPAPAPQQTAPVGMPSSDPTKTQPGETGPFDPNAEPPAPAPAPEPEAELAPPKPLQDTKEPAPEPEGITTFTFFEGVERGDANPNALYARGDSTQVTEAELREYFNAQGSQMLKRAFGDFDNYLAYMTEREQLIQSGDYDVGNWDEYTGALTEDELMILEGEDLTQYSDSDQDVYTEAYAQRMQEQSSAYDRWVNSEENQALLAKYGVGSTIYNNDGDKYEWNGSAYVKTVKQDQLGLADYVKMGIVTAMGIATGGAVSAVAPSLGTVGSSVVSNAITQAISTGSIDPDQLLQAAATAGFSQALNEVIGPALSEAMGGLDISEITGIEEVDNVINAMGQTALRQAVFDGSLNMDEIITSGVFATAGEFIDWFTGQMAVDPEQEAELLNNLQGMTDELNQEAFEAIERQFGEGALTDALNQMDADIAVMASQNLANMFAANNVEVQQTSDGIFEEVEVAEPTQAVTEQPGISWTPTADSPPKDVVDGWIADDQRPEGYEAMGVEDTYLAQWTGSNTTGEYYLIDTPDGYYVTDGVNVVKYRGTAADLDNMSWLDSHFYGGGKLPNTSESTAQFINFINTNSGTSEWSELFESIESPDQVPEPVDQPDILQADFSVDPITIEPDPIDQTIPPEEDIFADTTQEATGLEASVIEDLFGDYMDEFRQEFEGQQSITIEQVQEVVASALGNIEQPENLTQQQIQNIVNDAVSSIPQADTLSEQQVQDIVNNAVSAIEIPEGITTEEVNSIVNEAIAGIPAGTSPEQVQEIINQAISGIEIPEGMTPEQVQQIVDTAVSGIQFPEGIDAEDVDQIVSEAIRNIEFPEVDTLSNEEVQSIVDTAIGNIEFPEGVTAEQVQEIVQQQIANVPEGLTQDEVSNIVSQAIAGIQFPEGITAQDVQGIVDQAVSNIQFPEAVSTEQVQDIVDAAVAGIDIPEGISEEQVGNIVDTAIANIEFPEGVTQEQVNQIVNQAIGDIQFPEGVTQSQVTEIVNQAIAGIEFPEVDTLSTDEVQSIVNTAISDIEFPEGVTADQVLNIIQAQLEAQPEGLTSDDVNQIVSTAIGNIQFPASVTQEEVTDLLGEVEDTLSSSLESYQEGVQEELEAAEEERAVLGGQLGTLTTEVADIAEDLIGVGGDIEDLDERTQERLDELGLDLEGLGLLVNINFEALQQGMLTQESAMQELIEETTRQTEESLTERLEQAEEGFAINLSDTEANLLSQITNVEAGVLQQLAEVEGGLQEQFGDQFGQVQEQVAGLGEQVTGLGEQVAGVGEGLGQLGQALGTGLLGLAAAQPTAQEIAMAMPRQPVDFDPFLKGLSPFQPLTPLTLRPVQEKDALSELNKFIGRQSGMLV